MVVRPRTEMKPQIKTPSERPETAPQKPQRQPIPWETPQPKQIKVTWRLEAIGAARAAVERKAEKLRGYRFGPLKWEEMDTEHTLVHRTERHDLCGPTVLGWVEVVDWLGGWRTGGVVTAFVFNRGEYELGSWHWGPLADKPADSCSPIVRSSVAAAKLPLKSHIWNGPSLRFPLATERQESQSKFKYQLRRATHRKDTTMEHLKVTEKNDANKSRPDGAID